MSKRPQSTYRNSDLARSKVKKNRVVTLFSNIFMQHPSEIGLVEDRSNSTTIIRIIVGLLLVHIIIIGGIILHGKIEEEHETTVATLVPPPTAPVAEQKKNIRPEPKAGPQSNPAHISQVTAANAQATQQPAQPVAVVTPTQTQQTAATTTPVTPPAPANTASHTKDTPYKTVTLTSGKSLNALAREHGITLQQILAINPNITNPNLVAANSKIRIPLAADSTEAKDINQRKEEQRIQKEGLPYKVKRGDMLGSIANRFGTSVEAIQKLNNMGKSTNIRIGQEIKIPATDKARKALQK